MKEFSGSVILIHPRPLTERFPVADLKYPSSRPWETKGASSGEDDLTAQMFATTWVSDPAAGGWNPKEQEMQEMAEHK